MAADHPDGMIHYRWENRSVALCGLPSRRGSRYRLYRRNWPAGLGDARSCPGCLAEAVQARARRWSQKEEYYNEE